MTTLNCATPIRHNATLAALDGSLQAARAAQPAAVELWRYEIAERVRAGTPSCVLQELRAPLHLRKGNPVHAVTNRLIDGLRALALAPGDDNDSSFVVSHDQEAVVPVASLVDAGVVTPQQLALARESMYGVVDGSKAAEGTLEGPHPQRVMRCTLAVHLPSLWLSSRQLKPKVALAAGPVCTRESVITPSGYPVGYDVEALVVPQVHTRVFPIPSLLCGLYLTL